MGEAASELSHPLHSGYTYNGPHLFRPGDIVRTVVDAVFIPTHEWSVLEGVYVLQPVERPLESMEGVIVAADACYAGLELDPGFRLQIEQGDRRWTVIGRDRANICSVCKSWDPRSVSWRAEAEELACEPCWKGWLAYFTARTCPRCTRMSRIPGEAYCDLCTCEALVRIEDTPQVVARRTDGRRE